VRKLSFYISSAKRPDSPDEDQVGTPVHIGGERDVLDPYEQEEQAALGMSHVAQKGRPSGLRLRKVGPFGL